MHDVTIRNNLIETVSAGDNDGDGTGIIISKGPEVLPPGWNITIDHNTIISSHDFMGISAARQCPSYQQRIQLHQQPPSLCRIRITAALSVKESPP